MTVADLPKPQQLDLGRFPREPWAQVLVSAFNQLALQVLQALNIAAPKYKTLDFTTGPDVTASFPLDIPVEAFPLDVRVAGVISGDAGFEAVTPKWSNISTPGRCVRIRYITGLSANTTYSIRLAYS